MMFRTTVLVLFAAALVAGQTDDPDRAVPEITADDIEFMSADRSITSSCSTSGTTGSCCVIIVIKKLKINSKTCLKIKVDVEDMKVTGSLTVNDKELLNKDLLSAGTNLCVSLPAPASFLNVCLKIRYVDINIPEKMVDICTGISVSSLVGYDFPCIRYKNGKLSTHKEH